MPKLSLSVPHALGQEEAVRRLKERLSKLREAYQDQVTDLDEQWSGNTLNFRFTARGLRIRGQVAVGASSVDATAELPWAAMIFKGKIEQRLREELGRLLA